MSSRTPRERIKRAEGSGDGDPRSALDGVPQSLPSLMRAQRLQVKAGRVGFDWPSWREAWNKVREELTETDEALAAGDTARIRAELGDLLFSVVNVARLLEIDAEDSLRQAAETFTRRFKEVEAAMRAEGRQVGEASAEDLDRKWEAAKSREVPGQDGLGRTLGRRETKAAARRFHPSAATSPSRGWTPSSTTPTM